MKSIIFITLLLISNVFCAVDSFLDGLDRSFDEAERKMVDIYVTMPPEEVEKLIQIAQVSINMVQNGNAGKIQDFKYESAKIVMKWDGKEKIYEESSFKTGGMYARSNDKVGYNIKLQKKFLGRKNIRIRPDAGDRSHLRSKLTSDIANRLGLPSIQAVYARLYMNEEFWGLYTLLDAIKPSWIKQTFKPEAEEITTLFQCKTGGFNFSTYSANQCDNANDETTDRTVFKNFVNDINSCKSIDEIREIMDVDVFLKYIALEWLIGSYDHFLIYGHNFYFYKRETDGKWILIEHDFDNTFGNGVSLSLWSRKGKNQDGTGGDRGDRPIYYTFSDWEMNIPILKTLVYNNKEEFKNITREIMVAAFNPTMLIPHIDELQTFLLPYVEEDSIKGENGYLPGRINRAGIRQASSVTEFKNNISNSLKYWINTKFQVACDNYKFNKTEILEEAVTYKPHSFDYEYGKVTESISISTSTQIKTKTTSTQIKTKTTSTQIQTSTTQTSKPTLTPEEIKKLEEYQKKEKLRNEYLKLKEFWNSLKKKNPR